MFELIVLVLTILLFIGYSTRKPAKLPPGPPRLPIIGSLPFVAKHGTTFQVVQALSRKYGKICSFYSGSSPTIILNDLEMIKKLYKMEELSSRPPIHVLANMRYGDPISGLGVKGLLFSSGPAWKEQRRFALKNLKDFGFGKSSMQDMISHEAQKLTTFLKKQVGTPTSLNAELNISILSALWVILVGEELDLDNEKLLRVVNSVNDFVRGGLPASKTLLFNKFPRLFTMLPNLKGQVIVKVFQNLKDLVEEMVSQHIQCFDQTNSPRDYLDVHIQAQRSASADSSFYGRDGYEQAEIALMDLFLAGSETTSTSISWGLLYLLHHPEIQDRIHEDLDRVVGTDRLPTLEDESQMPYISAVIHEIHRCASIVYVGVPHYSEQSVEIDGYEIPKGSRVLANILQVMRNPDQFPDPETFRPERYLDEEGNFRPHHHVIPFLVGKRICLGASLAEKELFLFFTTLLQAFNFRPAPGSKLPPYSSESREIPTTNGIIRFCPEYKLILEERI